MPIWVRSERRQSGAFRLVPNFETHFLLAGHGLALLGTLALAATEAVGPPYVLLALLSLLTSVHRGLKGRGFELNANAANATTMLALVLILMPVLARGAAPIRAIAEYLLVLSALKLLAPKTNRDWLQVYLLSFFQLVSASALTIEPAFALLFLAYLLLAPWVLVLFLLRREVMDSGDPRRLTEESFVDPSLFRSVATITVLLFVSTLVVFVFFPRMGVGLFSSPLAPGTTLTGFSDEVALGDVTALKQDDSIALRVSVDRPELVRGDALYWRGAALDSFDGRRWRRGTQELRPLVRGEPGLFLANQSGRPGPVVREEFVLEPRDTPSLFSLGRPLQVHGPFSSVLVDGLGNLRVISAGGRTRYEVLVALAPRGTRPTSRSRTLPEVDARVPALARQLVSGVADEAGRARALLEYFRRGFVYTMDPGDPGSRDPIARFLFESRRGHCEYFASALAVMLRAVGIPSLVVNGYQGGEWNEYGRYFILRQSDAHSWVEAYVGGEWRTLDPTPGGGDAERRRPNPLAELLDAYRMRWYRYVINYSLNDQVEIAFSLRDTTRRLVGELTAAGLGKAWKRATAAERSRAVGASAAALSLLGVAAFFWFRVRRRGEAPPALGWASLRYLEMLRRLERRGLVKRPGETPEEFCRKVAPALDGAAPSVERLTALYQRLRFSGRSAEPEESRAEIEGLLAELEDDRERPQSRARAQS